ncbi:MAG: GlsB/YeaQ/YmgE family stress response membrane protein [Actinomycetota bacterium]|nr:GlsB/YeaQ/YmgE family stress response membrane protein [Actinomycetota bacterium]
MISSIIGAIIVGAIIGALGRLILPGRQNISIVTTIVIGIVASFVGGLLLGLTAYNNSNGGIPWLGWLVGAILAALGILAYGRMTNKSV